MGRLISIIQGPLGGQYARIERSGIPGEIRVRFFLLGHHSPEEDYFTDDLDDAIGTAQIAMEKIAEHFYVKEGA